MHAQPHNISIAITYQTPTYLEQAESLAKTLNLTVIPFTHLKQNYPYDFLLMFTPQGLALWQTSATKTKPFILDFLSGKLSYRAKQASSKNELIVKAMGAKPSNHPHILDITAGLGRDGFILASFGFHITLIEQSKIIHALLQDALIRAASLPASQRIMLICADSKNYLRSINNAPDIIYFDPMFPKREKSAQVKKEMILLQQLLGQNQPSDTIELFNLALTCATQRVVVKRAKLAPTISNLKPNFSLTGQSSRFDIYLT